MTLVGKERMFHEDHEDEPSTIAEPVTAPLGELLHMSMPAAEVAVKVCGEDSAEETGEIIDQKKRDILNTFKRRAFSRISFKGESGPLLSR